MFKRKIYVLIIYMMNRIIKAENIGCHMVMVQGAVKVKEIENLYYKIIFFNTKTTIYKTCE